jgi:hypothetical protein
LLIDAPNGDAKSAITRLDQPVPVPGQPRKHSIKSFQFVENARLQIDHCSIQQMSVLLHESGHWSISLRADQNPLQSDEPLNPTTAEPPQLFTSHLQRNEFHVSVRCYAAFGDVLENRLVGKPLIIPLDLRPFWVQRQRPYQLFQTGSNSRIRDHFELIDRVEIEFAVRRD